VRNIITSAVAVLVLGAASAHAQSDNSDRQVVVNYADLNVASQDGAKALYARVNFASAEVCGYEPAITDIAATQVFRSCSEAARARAIKALPFDLSERMGEKNETLASR